MQTYIIDAFTQYAASGQSTSPKIFPSFLADSFFHIALAAVSCFRSLAGFGFPLFAPAMYKALGYGKGDTILGVAAIVIGIPA